MSTTWIVIAAVTWYVLVAIGTYWFYEANHGLHGHPHNKIAAAIWPFTLAGAGIVVLLTRKP